ncbi:MAG: pyridoxal 5'-phosphate synthase glutaminase subunit PdxT [Lachnospiraceae bacterium]|nr:pyridoxal 5'-phosphate synthase glutaminase subunit PdxT [Lachnospiraceae bacterium]
MKIAVLAVQGAFEEQEKVFRELGADTIQLRQAKDLDGEFDALVLPGGESTVQGKLLRELDMYDKVCKLIRDGMPVFATCAGLILLAERIAGDEAVHIGTLPVTVKRNAYGRQLGSFHYAEGEFGDICDFPMEFIRAPYVESVSDGVEIMATVDGRIVGVRYENQLAMAFHPELGGDHRIHQMFLDSILKS